MTVIGSLNYKIGADVSDFERGAALTKKEINTLQRVFYGTATEAEKINSTIARLNRGFAAGAIEQSQYAEAVNRIRSKSKEVQEAERARMQMEQRAAAIRDKNLTDEQRYARALEETRRELAKLVAAGQLSRGDAAAELRRVKERDPALIARRQAEEQARLQRDADHQQRLARRRESAGRVGGILYDRSGLAGMIAMAGGALSLAVAYQKVNAAIAEVSQRMTEIDELSKKAGEIGVDLIDLQKLQYATGLDAGLDAKATGDAYSHLQVRIAEAAQGAGRALPAFRALGIDLTEMRNAGPVESLMMIADGLANVKDQADKAYITNKLFGSQATAMSILLAQGSDHLRGYSQEFEQLGLGLRSVDANRVELANDEMGKLGQRVQAVKDHFIVGLAPAIVTVNDYLMQMMTDSQTGGSTIQQFAERASVGVVGLAGQFKDAYNEVAGFFSLDWDRFMSGFNNENENAAVDAMLTKLDDMNRTRRESLRLQELTRQLQANPAEAEATMAAEEARLNKLLASFKQLRDTETDVDALAATEKLIADNEAALATIEAARQQAEKQAIETRNKEQEALTNQINQRTEAIEQEIATLKNEGQAFEEAALRAKGASELQIEEIRKLTAERDALKAAKEAEQAAEQANKSADDQIRQLQLQLGGEAAAREFELQKGVTAERLAQIDALKEQVKQQEEAERVALQLKNDAERVVESLRAPADVMTEEVQRLHEMLVAGHLTREQFAQAAAGVINRSEGQATAPASVSFGSAEAYRQRVELQQQRLRDQGGKTMEEKLLNVADQQLEVNKQMLEGIRNIQLEGV